MPGVSSTKRRGKSRGLKPLLEFWYFEKKYPLPSGGQGGEVGSQLILEGNTSVRDEYVKVSLIWGNFYPHYEFIKLFSNLHTPPY